jgi:hypothetical protein
MAVIEIPYDYRKGKDVHTVVKEMEELCADEAKDSHVGVMIDIWELRQVLTYIRTIETSDEQPR